MRLTVICGLDHIAPEFRQAEAARLLHDLAQQILDSDEVKVGDVRIMNAPNGTRVGVSDIFEH